MPASALRSERATGSKDEAWLVGFPIVALLVLMVVVQSALAMVGTDPLASGVCRQTGASDAAFMALMLH
jgi:hypothetical protein